MCQHRQLSTYVCLLSTACADLSVSPSAQVPLTDQATWRELALLPGQ